VSPVCVAPRFMAVPVSMLMWKVIVSYVDCLPKGRASWFMYGSHVGCIFFVLYVMGLGSFLWLVMACYGFLWLLEELGRF
jgi:hypothetical protein